MELKLPPRYEAMDVEEILNMKVQLVHSIDGHIFSQEMLNLEVASNVVNLADFVGPMVGKIGNEWCLRFEDKEANRRLSQ